MASERVIEIEGLAEVVLNVHDRGAALAFYRDLLGLRQLSADDAPGPIFLQAGSATAALPSLVVLVPMPAGSPAFAPPRPLHHLALAVSAASFEATRERLLHAGLTVRDGIHPILPARTIYVDDPEGNEVELMAPREAMEG